MFKKNPMRACRPAANRAAKSLRFLNEPALAALVTGLLLLTGCQTVPTLPAVNLSEPGWSVRRGQAAWNPAKGETEIVGELLVATHDDGR